MAETKKFNYIVKMSCSGCSTAVDNILKRIKGKDEGLEDYSIDQPGQHVTITSKPEVEGTVFQKLTIAKETKRADKDWNELEGEAEAQGY